MSLVRDLHATGMGVDQEGNLWAWQSGAGRIDLYSPDGEVIAKASLRDAVSVAVDRHWGVAGIVGQGKELRLVPFGGGSPLLIPLPDEARGVAWVDAETVAVAPALANHRAQLWQIREKTLIKKLGVEEVIEPKIGTTVLRSIAMQYDPGRKLLYTLDSFKGDLQVFALDGRLVRHETFPQVERRELEAWLAQTDREMRERHETFAPGIRWFSLAVDAAGAAWSVQACDRAQARATLLQIPLLGKRQSTTLEAACCALPLVIWKGWLILYTDPAAPREICNLIRRIP
ncbi:MAG TPA: hypothetical protein VF173_29520 [Thermoanaerobaculia bacterium]|nr:hypothetical protein [Thermoanaerobaculia bacterium]